MPKAVAILSPERLRKELRRRRLSQRAFADLAGLRAPLVSSACLGRPTTPATVARIVQALANIKVVAS